jgi:hypothetical protein
LRNAGATFGEGTPPYESIRTVVEDHLNAMRAKGSKTDLTGVRLAETKPGGEVKATTAQQSSTVAPGLTMNLVYRPKHAK